MSGNRKKWFWTPERLVRLGQVLDSLSERDDQGPYIGSIGLTTSVARNASLYGLNIDLTQAQVGLKIMVFLGVLDPGKSGLKKPGYKRRYHLEKLREVTMDDLQRFRVQRGAKSSMPPIRRR